MDFRSRVLAIGFFAVIMQWLILFSAYYYYIDPKTADLEEKLVEKNLHRGLELLQRELFHLERLTQIFAQLPLIQQLSSEPLIHDPTPLKTLQEKMLRQELNLLYILNSKNEVIWSNILDLNAEQPYPQQPFLANLWEKKPRFLEHISALSIQSGIYNSTLGPMLVVSAPITAPNSTKVQGTLITGRLITLDVILLMQSLTYTDLKLWPIGVDELNSKQRAIIRKIAQSDTDFQIDQNGHFLRGYMSLHDLNQEANLLISITQPRVFSQLLEISLGEIGLALSAFQIIVLLFLSLFIYRTLLKPTRQLITQINNTKKEWLPPPIITKPWNEITLLVSALSNYISRQQTLKAQETSIAYRQGMKESQQDLFRELEEILKPLVAGIELTEQKLSSLPVNDLEWIIAECRSGQISLAQLDDYTRRLQVINEKLRVYQKQTRLRLYELVSKTLRNAAALRSQSRSTEALRKFTPILGYNRKRNLHSNKI